jgi:hypothetical protein
MKGFAEARKLEKLELRILLELRKLSPGTDRVFPVALQQWGSEKLEVNGIYVSNRGEFFFVDFDAGESAGQDGELTLKMLESRKALDLINLLSQMGVVGNRSSLSELAYAEVPLPPPRIIGMLPPPGIAQSPAKPDEADKDSKKD